MKHMGIYSGSFDPVHAGHIAFATEAAKVLALDTIVFMPEALPRHKPHVSPISERLSELEIALADTPFMVLDAHCDRFTVDETLTELEATYPDTDFTFLIGSDVALNLSSWNDIDHLTSRYSFAVGMRQDSDVNEVSDALKKAGAHFILVTTPMHHISSSQLRPHR